MNAIELKGLTKFYGKTRGIDRVDLTVKEGDFFGFIGPNGAGKSTTIRTLLGLIRPTAGSAAVFGKDSAAARREILSTVGYMPSEAVFYRGMRVRDVLKLSAKLKGVDCREETERLCRRLELDTAKKVEELSLGNRKKVGIVCALQTRPRLYILDEPTSGLDPLMQKAFYQLLTERNREGATVFLSSHILSEVSKYCQNAAVICDGRILACDRVEKLGHTDVKRVTLHGVDGKIGGDGVRNLTYDGNTASFLYGGNPKDLLSLLNTLSFQDFSVADPDLEEVFLHFYEKEDGQHDGFGA